jgi:hypothetical protein
MLIAARRSSSHCVDSLQFEVCSPSSANCQLRRQARGFLDKMADIQRSSKLAMRSLRPWHLALVTQLLALQAPAELKSALVSAVDGEFLPIPIVVQ